MNKSQLIDAVARRSGVSPADARKSIDAFIGVTTDSLRTGDRVTLAGFGSFELSRRPARVGRNFLTGTPVKIPPRSVVKFRSSSPAMDL